jgi:ribosomal protein L32
MHGRPDQRSTVDRRLLATFQRCSICGLDEVRGHFCSRCGAGTYVLVDHRHRLVAPGVSACPLDTPEAAAYITGRRKHRPHRLERAVPDDAAADRAEAEGRREQTCPDCLLTEAGGYWCTFCSRPMHPDEWHRGRARGAAIGRQPGMLGRGAPERSGVDPDPTPAPPEVDR